jgi:hypothetical protein
MLVNPYATLLYICSKKIYITSKNEVSMMHLIYTFNSLHHKTAFAYNTNVNVRYIAHLINSVTSITMYIVEYSIFLNVYIY